MNTSKNIAATLMFDLMTTQDQTRIINQINKINQIDNINFKHLFKWLLTLFDQEEYWKKTQETYKHAGNSKILEVIRITIQVYIYFGGNMEPSHILPIISQITNKDRSTVYHYIKTSNEFYEYHSHFRNQTNTIINLLDNVTKRNSESSKCKTIKRRNVKSHLRGKWRVNIKRDN